MSTPALSPPRPQSTPPTPRQPLTPTRITPLSIHLFQARHALQFAHLRTDVPTYLQAESSRLEEERRLGREKRESLASIRHATIDAKNGDIGKRPLSLVTKHTRTQSQLGITRPTSHQIHRGRGGSLQITINPRPIRSVSENSRPIPPLRSLTESDTEPEINFDMPEPSPPILPAPRNTLTISIRSSHSSHSDHKGNTSNSKPPSIPQSQSTYSWASSFSGETSELRTAAHYVPASSSTPDIILPNDTDTTKSTEYLNNPEQDKKDRRRKRIVAIAHTVRQLEGVGSREVEDPELYGVLVKAWNERNGLNIPIVPLPPTQAQYDVTSPPDPDFRTPSMDGEGSFTGSSVLGSGSGSGDLSRSTRYSYASMLHDLALDDGLEAGGRLMKEKAWLRGSMDGGAGLGLGMGESKRYGVDDIEFSPPVPPFLPPAETRRLESPINLPGRTLRRQEGTIPTRPGVGEAGPSRWGLGGLGLGFTEAWWDKPQQPGRQVDEKQQVDEQVSDFHQGEVNPPKALYTTPPRTKRISRRNSSPMGSTRRMNRTSGMVVSEGLGDEQERGVGLEMVELGSPIDLLKRRGNSRSRNPRGSRCLSHCRRNTIHSIISCRSKRGELEVEVEREGEGEEGEEGDYSIGLDKSSLQLTPVQIVRASISHLTPGATPIYTQFTRHKQVISPTPRDEIEAGRSPTRDQPSQVLYLDSPKNHTIPFNSYSSHPQLHFDRFSYPGMSGGNDIPLPTLEPVGGGGEGGVNLPSSVGSRQKERVHTPPLHTIATLPVDPPNLHSGERSGSPTISTVQLAVAPIKTKRATSPSVLFFLGFLLPFLWLIGGWTAKKSAGTLTDLEKGGTAAIASSAVNKPWYTSWAYHPDRWVRRCRIATAVSVPMLVTGGILAGVLVTTLR